MVNDDVIPSVLDQKTYDLVREKTWKNEVTYGRNWKEVCRKCFLEEKI